MCLRQAPSGQAGSREYDHTAGTHVYMFEVHFGFERLKPSLIFISPCFGHLECRKPGRWRPEPLGFILLPLPSTFLGLGRELLLPGGNVTIVQWPQRYIPPHSKGGKVQWQRSTYYVGAHARHLELSIPSNWHFCFFNLHITINIQLNTTG